MRQAARTLARKPSTALRSMPDWVSSSRAFASTSDAALPVAAAAVVTPPIWAEISLDPALLADYVGHYRLDTGKVLRVTQDGARLFLEWPGRPKEEAIAKDDHCFRARLSDWSVSFEADGVSLASHAVLEQNGRTWRASRIADDS